MAKSPYKYHPYFKNDILFTHPRPLPLQQNHILRKALYKTRYFRHPFYKVIDINPRYHKGEPSDAPTFFIRNYLFFSKSFFEKSHKKKNSNTSRNILRP